MPPQPGPAPTPPPLRVHVDHRGTTRTITAAGEIDIATVTLLHDAVSAAFKEAPEVVVVDLGETEFIDSTGIRLFLELRARAARAGVRLVLLPGPPQVQRVFEIAGLLSMLPFAALPAPKPAP